MLTRLRRLDRLLLGLIALVVLAGIVVIFTAGGGMGAEGGRFLLRRIYQLALGLGLMLAVALVDYRWLRKLSRVALGISLLTLVYVLAMVAIRGTRGWIPCFGFTLQAVDLARVGLIFFMADRLAVADSERGYLRRFGWPLAALALFCLLVCLQPDFGSALALGMCGAVLLFAAGLPKRLFLVGGLGLALLIGLGYAGSERIRERIDLTLHFDAASNSAGTYQLKQSLIGVGAGGWLGQGVGMGRQQNFLPDHHTDFIFAIVGEEFGFLGSMILLLLLGALAFRVLRIAIRQVDPYARLLAVGVAGMFFVYLFLNVAVVLGLFPLTGVPLPFISHGGSALVMHLVALGLVLAVSSDSRRARAGVGRRKRGGKVLLEDLYSGSSR